MIHFYSYLKFTQNSNKHDFLIMTVSTKNILSLADISGILWLFTSDICVNSTANAF